MKITNLLKILRRPLVLGAFFLIALSASRLILALLFWDRVSATGGMGFILLQGVRFDLILIGMLIGPVLVFKPLFHTARWMLQPTRWFWSFYLGLATAAAFFVEASTWSFIREYDSRPNYIFVEYLAYPRELLATLGGSHLLELLVFSALTLLIFWSVFRWNRIDPAASVMVPAWQTLLAAPVLAVLVVLVVRSTLDHRPINPSVAAFSPDSMVNQLPLNSPYSLLYAIYEQRRDAKDSNVRYGAMTEDEVLMYVLEDAGIKRHEVADGRGPSIHLQEPTFQFSRPKNIVIVLEESLGAEFVGSLGGRPLTPFLDAAASKGIWFDQLYATGTRSARGIEAVVTGITPTARESVVKLAETQNHFFTLASLLRAQGLSNQFHLRRRSAF